MRGEGVRWLDLLLLEAIRTHSNQPPTLSPPWTTLPRTKQPPLSLKKSRFYQIRARYANRLFFDVFPQKACNQTYLIGIVNSIQVGGSGEIIPSAGGLIQSVNILPSNNKIHTQGPTSGGTLMCQSVNLVAENQVWSLTHFILVSFLCKKNH